MKLSVEALGKTLAGRPVLRSISFEAGPGETVAVLGANGAGKTTLLRCLASVLSPDSGRVLFDGEPCRRDRLDLRRRAMFLPDSPVFAHHASLARHVAIVLELYLHNAPEVETEVVSLLEAFDLLPLAFGSPWELSRGEQAKGALVPLLVADPELWLLDEPFASGIDPAGLAILKGRISASRARGRTVIFSTQIVELAERLADRVLLLEKNGRFRFGTTEELRRDSSLEEAVRALSEQA